MIIKKGSGQRSSGMEEDFTGNEGSQRTVALEKEEEGEMMMEKRRNRFWENVQLLLR